MGERPWFELFAPGLHFNKDLALDTPAAPQQPNAPYILDVDRDRCRYQARGTRVLLHCNRDRLSRRIWVKSVADLLSVWVKEPWTDQPTGEAPCCNGARAASGQLNECELRQLR
jgi:hypothetical protein